MAETLTWTGEDETEGAAATTSNTAGTNSSQVTIVPAGSGSAQFSKLNPLIAGHGSIRLLSPASSGNRCRAYFGYAAATDAVSSLWAMRFRQDPGVATGIFQHIISPGSTGMGALNMKRSNGVGQIVWVGADGTEKYNFGPITYGSDVDDWFMIRANVLRSTASASPFDGTYQVQMFDYSGQLLGQYTDTAVSTNTTQFVRGTWGLNTAVLSDFEIAEMKAVTDPPLQYLALPTAPPPTPPALATPTLHPNGIDVYAPGTAAAGGALTYSISPAPLATPGPGWFVMERKTADYTAVVSVTEAGTTPQTTSKSVTIPKLVVGRYGPRVAAGPTPGNAWA